MPGWPNAECPDGFFECCLISRAQVRRLCTFKSRNSGAHEVNPEPHSADPEYGNGCRPSEPLQRQQYPRLAARPRENSATVRLDVDLTRSFVLGVYHDGPVHTSVDGVRLRFG